MAFDNRTVTKRPQRTGVTLLEAVMVILILSAAMLAIPGFSRNFGSQSFVVADAGEVAEVFRLVRETAMLNDCTVEVQHITLKHPADGIRRDAIQWRALPGPFSENLHLTGQSIPRGRLWMADPIWMSPDTQITSRSSIITFDSSQTAARDITWVIRNQSDKRNVRFDSVQDRIDVEIP